MWCDAGGDFDKAMLALTPLGRIGQPNDIADVAVLIPCDDSMWLTGERLTAAGGYRRALTLAPSASVRTL